MSKVSGIILAGGRSSRMGQDKGMMYFRGEPMIAWVIQSLKGVTTNISISTNDVKYTQWGFPIIQDEVTQQGPLAGVVAALEQSKNQMNVIVSCDMPFMRPVVLLRLLEESKNAEITIPIVGGKSYPLCGCYQKSCTPKLRKLLMKGERKMKTVIQNFKLKEVEFPIVWESYFQNINTPKEKELLEL